LLVKLRIADHRGLLGEHFNVLQLDEAAS
jgi:hypothetical protein